MKVCKEGKIDVNILLSGHNFPVLAAVEVCIYSNRKLMLVLSVIVSNFEEDIM
jgi:hypothetical protein